jgi:hypothetical protein
LQTRGPSSSTTADKAGGPRVTKANKPLVYHDVQDSLSTTDPTLPVLVLLQYPFIGGVRIEKAAEGLKHCSKSLLISSEEAEQHEISEEKILQLQQEATGKERFIRITTVDCEHLEEKKWLNDTIVDFWMQW